jgi:Chaperone of endosialidase
MKRSPVRPAFLFMLVVVTCFAPLPSMQAVTPAPDGGYPGANTAEGTNALFSRTTGVWDTAIGAQALYHTTTGTANTALGYNALLNNISGDSNTAIGAFALLNNTTTQYVSPRGSATGIGLQNTAVGAQTLVSNKSGVNNTAIGYQALYSNTEIFFSQDGTLKAGNSNTATGSVALRYNTTGSDNTADGFGALQHNTDGIQNTAVGSGALQFSDPGSSYNTAVGANSSASGGVNNVAVGNAALYNNRGFDNTALGAGAGFNLTTGDSNIDIANGGVAGESNTTRIGDVQTRTFIAGIRARTTANANAVPVVIDSAGQLGTASSSRRFKNEIKPMDKASEAILALKPVTFHYKSDSTGTPQFGLIAEEVAAVNPDLIVRDENDEIYTVRYDAVNAMLLNEFLKEHRHVQEQDAIIARQQKQIDALAAGLEKVSAQLELNKPAPRTVVNSQQSNRVTTTP